MRDDSKDYSPQTMSAWSGARRQAAMRELSASSLPRATDAWLHAASRRRNDGGGVRPRCVQRYNARMRAASERNRCTSTGSAPSSRSSPEMVLSI
jgi:hypothetical protein